VEILRLIYKKHKFWMAYLKKLGCPEDLCEDITQEMYIKIDSYLKKTNNDIMYNDDVNNYFIYLTLKSLFIDYTRKAKRIKMVEIEDAILDNIRQPQNEDQILSDIFDSDLDEDLDGKTSIIEEWYNEFLYLDFLEKDEIPVNYSKKEMEEYYLRRIFKDVFYDKVKLSKLSRDTNITYWSLRNTINIIKKQIKKRYENRKRT
tara:strand:- start:1214 stop:1822 length:609 start_codon:yes stop_codon:yes gene_type:complete